MSNEPITVDDISFLYWILLKGLGGGITITEKTLKKYKDSDVGSIALFFSTDNNDVTLKALTPTETLKLSVPPTSSIH